MNIDEQEQIVWSKEVDDYVRQVHFVFNGQNVLCTTSSGKVYLFAKDGNRRLFAGELHKGAILSSNVSQPFNLLVTGGEDGTLLLTDLETGKIRYRFEAPGKWIEHVAFSPDGKWVAFSCGSEVKIVDRTGKLYDTISKAENTISAIVWHQGSETLAVGFFGGVFLYNLPQRNVYAFLPWKNAVVSLTISPDKKYVCSGTQDCQVHIWPLPYKPESDLAMSGFPNKVKHVHWHCKGSLLATNSGQTVVLWDFSGKGPAQKMPDILKGHFLNVTALAFQHEGDRLVSGDEGGLLFFFDPKKSSHSDFIVSVGQPVTTLCWSPDDKMVVVGTAEGGLFMIKNL
jgi:WD40 repeat protein